MPAITSQTEPLSFAAEFIKSDMGSISYEQGALITGQNLKAGTVLGKITASGKFTILAPVAADGSQVAVAVLRADCDATAADKNVTVIERLGELVDASMTYPGGITGPQKVTAKANLAAKFLIVH